MLVSSIVFLSHLTVRRLLALQLLTSGMIEGLYIYCFSYYLRLSLWERSSEPEIFPGAVAAPDSVVIPTFDTSFIE